MEAMSESRNLIAKLIGNLKFVGRLMDALDHISAMATDQAAKAWILYRSGNKANLDRFMNPTAEQISNAKERVIMEGTPQRFRAQRLREILDEWVPEEIGMKARELHRMVTFKETPQGIAGVIHEGIVMVDKKFPAFRFLSGTQFTRFAMNYVNMGTNYAAPIALFRWYMSDPARAEGKHGLEYSQERRELLLAQAAIGTLLGTITAALFLSDDDEAEERFIDITGSFKSLTSKKRGQLLSEGRKPYSIRVGDTYISYRQLGFGGLLGAIGELRDRQLFEADKWNAETLPWKVADAAFAGAFIVRDSSSLSGLSEFLGFANSYRYDVDSAIKKDVPRYLAKLSGSFIPNIMKEVDAWADPSIFPARAGHEYFLQQVPFMRRDVGEGPALNVLGEPVRVERYPYSRWIKTRNAGDVAWETLGVLASRGVFMPTVGATSTVKEDGTRRRMTDAEVYRYQERTGQEYRKWIETNHRKLKAMTPIDAADFIDTHADKIRSRVRSEIQRSVK